MQEAAIDIDKVYWIVGTLVVMNLGTIGSIIVGGARALWFVSKLHSQIEQNTRDINAAHQKIREFEKSKN